MEGEKYSKTVSPPLFYPNYNIIPESLQQNSLPTGIMQLLTPRTMFFSPRHRCLLHLRHWFRTGPALRGRRCPHGTRALPVGKAGAKSIKCIAGLGGSPSRCRRYFCCEMGMDGNKVNLLVIVCK